MSALHECGARSHRDERARRPLHLIRRPHLGVDENLRLVQIWGHEEREWREPARDQLLGIAIEQPVAGRCHHHGIEHVGCETMTRDAFYDRLDDFSRPQHPGFDRGGPEVLRDCIDLLRHERGGQRLPGGHPERILRGDRGNRAGSVDAELMERLEIGLYAGGAPGIRSRNGERDSHGSPGRALAKASARAILGAPVTSTRTHIRSNLQSTVRDLQRRKARGRRGLAVVEGVRLVEEALAAGLEFKGALVAPELARTTRGQTLTAELASHAVPVEEVGARTFGDLAGTDTPQGILAIVQPRAWELTHLPAGPLLVVDSGPAVISVSAHARGCTIARMPCGVSVTDIPAGPLLVVDGVK